VIRRQSGLVGVCIPRALPLPAIDPRACLTKCAGTEVCCPTLTRPASLFPSVPRRACSRHALIEIVLPTRLPLLLSIILSIRIRPIRPTYSATHTHTSSWRSLHTPAHRQDGHCPGTFRHGPLRSPVQHSAASLWSLEFYTGRPKCRVFHILKSSRRGNNGSSLFLPTCVQNIELPAVRLGISQRVAPRQHLPTSYEFVPDSMVNFTIPNNLTFRLIWCAGSSGW
jgi:hypothetical protein